MPHPDRTRLTLILGCALALSSCGGDLGARKVESIIEEPIFVEIASTALGGAEVARSDAPAPGEPAGYVADVKPTAVAGLTKLLGPTEGHDAYIGNWSGNRADYVVDASLLADDAGVRKFFSGLVGGLAFKLHEQLRDLKGPQASDNDVQFSKELTPSEGDHPRLTATFRVPRRAGGVEVVLYPVEPNGKRRIRCYVYQAPTQ